MNQPPQSSPAPSLVSLLEDQQKRWRQGEHILVESYLECHPGLRDNTEAVLDLIGNELLLRQEAGETPSLTAFVERFPQWAAELKVQFEVEQAIGVETVDEAASPSAGAPLIDPSATAATPQIPDFEIQAVLGKGGMGVVYKARQLSLKRLVAIKMILSGGRAQPEMLSRFQQEAEAVARLHHPNIVQIFAIGQHDGCPFLALEFSDGGSLDKALGHQPQPGRTAAQLAEILARAIQHAHQHQIIHRDLKPSNVLLQLPDGALQMANQRQGGPGPSAISPLQFAIPKITDFGLAKQLDSDSGQTQSGAILGTPSYMAPEQAAGNPQQVGPAADIYALGAILYEMLTGWPPFRGASPMETVNQVLTRDVTPPSKLVPRLHRDLETICLKCLAKEPRERYPSALALAQDLERFRLEEPILARPQSLASKLWRKVRRNLAVSAAAVVVVLALAAAGAVAFLTGEDRDQARHDRLVTETYQKIKDGLQSEVWTAACLEEMDGHLAELERLAGPDAAGLARKNVHEQLARAVHGMIQAPRLEAEQVAGIGRALDLLTPRDAAAARLLRRDLEERIRGWESVFELPRNEPETVFDPAAVIRDGAGFKRLPSPGAQSLGSDIALSRHTSGQEARLEAVFGADWESASAVGLLLSASGGYAQPVYCLEFSANGRALVGAAGAKDRLGEVRIWDVVGDRPALVYAADRPGALWAAFTPDGTRLAVANSNSSRVLFLDPASGGVVAGFDADAGGVACLAYSPDGKVLATGTGVAGKSGEVSLWDAATGRKQATLDGFTHIVARLTFSPDGRLLAAGSHDRTIKVWDVASRQAKLSTLPMHLDFVSCGRFSSDSRLFVAPAHTNSSEAGKLVAPTLLWDTKTGLVQGFTGGGHAGGISALAFAPQGKTLASASAWGRTVFLHDAPGGAMRHFIETGPAPKGLIFTALEFSPDGKTLAVASDDRAIRLWDVARRSLRRTFEERGYTFLLRPMQFPTAEGAAGKEPSKAHLPVRQGGALLQLLRNGVLLREQQVNVAQHFKGPLRLTAARDGGRLSFQVESLPPLEFEDTLPLSRGEAGVFGLHWPAGVRLESLRASRLALARAASPLERGDELYNRAQHAEALALYQEQARAAGAGRRGQEARVKAAYCLRSLNREEEAADLFERIAAEDGDHWPAVAGSELLMARVRQGRLDDADAVLETIASRFPHKVAALVPQNVRDSLVQSYVADFSGLNLFLARLAPEVVRNLHRARRVQDVFGVPPAGRVHVQYAFLRAYHFTGQLDEALAVAEDLLDNQDYWPHGLDGPQRADLIEQYSWLLRQRGEPARALAAVDGQLFANAGVYRTGAIALLLERARAHVALARWEEAEKDLDELLRLEPAGAGPYDRFAGACLARGFLRERRGDAAGAPEAWTKGLYEEWQQAASQARPGAAAPLLPQAWRDNVFPALVLASLAGNISDGDAQAIIDRLTARVGGNSTVALLQKGALRLPPAVFREMCRTSTGRAAARRLALGDLSYADFLRTPALLISAEMLHQGAAPGKLSPEQERVLWEVAEKLHAAYSADKLSQARLLQLALAWKGTSGFLGWGGVAPALDPSLRGPLAYVMGHRYLRLNQRREAASLFRTALTDAPVESPLRRLAQVELDRLKGA